MTRKGFTLLELLVVVGIMGLLSCHNRDELFLAILFHHTTLAIANLSFVVLTNLPAVDGHHKMHVLVTAEEDMQRIAVRLYALDLTGIGGNACRSLSLNGQSQHDKRQENKKIFQPG